METAIRHRKRLREPSRGHFPQYSKYRTTSVIQISWLSWLLMMLVFYFSIVSFNILANNHLPTPKRAALSHADEFIEENAREHLDAFVNMGARVAGYYHNDIMAHEYIGDYIRKVRSTSKKHAEIDIQFPSGSFFFPDLDGFMSVYSNITNTVVKVTSQQSDDNALLLNCHTDSVSNGPGASDDAVACSVLLEIFRAVMADEMPLLHPLIFLFNGAEETILQASHGFITQHKWVDQIKAFINLEAAGAGGKELVFQTGPNNPWLAYAWAKHAPHPHGSSIAQDLFQSGVIPSDTDFRIFRDHGKKPGIDLAYVKNGYVYHTIHDKPSMIQPGCVQRAGENIHRVVKHLVQSTESLIPDPSEYRSGSVIYFDFFGLTMIVLPMWIAVTLNYVTILLVIFYIGFRMIDPTMSGFTKHTYCNVLVKAVAITILSYAAAFLCLFIVAAFMTKMQRPLSWYANTPLAIGLYFPAGLMGMMGVHSTVKSYVMKNIERRILENLFFDATVLIWSILIFQTRNIGSSHYFTIPTLFAVVGRGMVGFDQFSIGSNTPGFNRVFIYLALMALTTSLHISKLLIVGDFFVTLSGRAGSEMPPDYIICSIIGLCIVSCFSYQVCTTYLINSVKWIYLILTVLLLTSIVTAFSTFGFPFDNDPISPTNKRFIAQHTQREFFDLNGKLAKTDSGLLVSHLDGTADVYHAGSEALMNSPIATCEGVYCEMPYSLPVMFLVKKYQYIPTPPPPPAVTSDIHPFEVSVKKSVSAPTDGNVLIMYSVSIRGPSHMTVILAPTTQESLIEWSFEGSPKGRNSTTCGRECYYILYTGGVVHPTWEFWLKFDMKSPVNGAVFSLDVSAHYRPGNLADRVNDQTPELLKLTSDLHQWVAPMTWVSTLKSYKF